MGCEPGIFSGRPCDWPGCAVSTNPSVSFAHLSSRTVEREEGSCGQGDRYGCASRLLRGRDRGGRGGPLGWPDRDEARPTQGADDRAERASAEGSELQPVPRTGDPFLSAGSGRSPPTTIGLARAEQTGVPRSSRLPLTRGFRPHGRGLKNRCVANPYTRVEPLTSAFGADQARLQGSSLAPGRR